MQNFLIFIVLMIVLCSFILFFVVRNAINGSKLAQDVERLKEMAALKWNMEPEDTEVELSKLEPQQSFRNCPNCDYVADARFIFCPDCGEKLPKELDKT